MAYFVYHAGFNSRRRGGEKLSMSATGDWRSLYPFQSHEMILGGGQRYHYLDEGSGPTLLLVHGNPTWSFYWRNLILALRPAVSRRGRGSYRLRAVGKAGGEGLFVSAGTASGRSGRTRREARSAADYAGGPRLGRGDRHGDGRGGAGAVQPVRADEHGGVSHVALPVVDPRLPDTRVWPAGRARSESVCPGRAQQDGLQTRADDGGGQGGLLGPLRLVAASRGRAAIRVGHSA